MRPIYVVDYAVASQPEGFELLREILNRHAWVIGAHLHPWINPPFEETVSEYNSFAGNLSAEFEERKLRTLIKQIEKNFGITPLFFKAGRYGTGRNTMATLLRLGLVVDFSIMPITDMRTRGGPDFRLATSQSYCVANNGIVSIPMTRDQVGLTTPMPLWLHGLTSSKVARRFHIPGILARLRLANTITLTPEGVTPEEQIRLIKLMISRGHRTFVLHYQNSSLGQHTPYVKNKYELDNFVLNIEAVCRYFSLKEDGSLVILLISSHPECAFRCGKIPF